MQKTMECRIKSERSELENLSPLEILKAPVLFTLYEYSELRIAAFPVETMALLLGGGAVSDFY